MKEDQPYLGSSYWSPRRKELLDWFQRNAPSLGEIYHGAVQLLNEEPPIAGRSHFICHAVREIRNNLPNFISGHRVTILQYKNRIDGITAEWKKLPSVNQNPDAAGTNQTRDRGVWIPSKLHVLINGLVEDHIQARQRPEQIAQDLFVGLAPENTSIIDQIRPVVIHWLDITEWFVKRVHRSTEKDEDLLNEKFYKRFEQFEATLGSLVRAFFSTTSEIDDILEKANS